MKLLLRRVSKLIYCKLLPNLLVFANMGDVDSNILTSIIQECQNTGKNRDYLNSYDNYNKIENTISIEDGTEKYILKDNDDLPEFFVLISRTKGNLQTNISKADHFSKIVPKALSKRILRPVKTGEFNDRLWAAYDFKQPVSKNRYIRYIQRVLLCSRVLQWQHAMTKHINSKISNEKYISKLLPAMKELANDHDLPQHLRLTTEKILSEIQISSWNPYFTFSHNDLWMGNVLLSKSNSILCRDFFIIDWAGASEHGFPFLDLLRVAESFNIPTFIIRRYLQKQCMSFHCSTTEIYFYLVLGFAALRKNLGYFPKKRFIKLYSNMYNYLNDIV